MIIVDTGFWLALANRNDKWHQQSERVLETIKEPLVTTWPVLTETCHLLLRQLGSFPLLTFVKSIQDPAFEIFDIQKSQQGQIPQLMKKYQDLPMDLADASLILLAEHLGHGRILSTDMRDFKTYKWKQRKPFKNLLVP